MSRPELDLTLTMVLQLHHIYIIISLFVIFTGYYNNYYSICNIFMIVTLVLQKFHYTLY